MAGPVAQPNLKTQRRLESQTLPKRLYRAAPWYVQNVLTSLYGLKMQRYSTSRHVQWHVAELMESQWLTADELYRLQSAKLRMLIDHVYRNVPYYRDLFKERGLTPADIREPADLQKLPILTKQVVREHWERLLTVDADRSRLHYTPTSGTTGTPLTVYITEENLATERAMHLRQRKWAGFTPGDRRATFSGFMVVPPDRRDLPLWRYNLPEDRMFFSVNHMTQDNVGLYVEKLREFQPQFVEGYGSYLSILARQILRQGEVLPVQAAFTFSETLYPHARRDIETAFQAKVFDWYGLTEQATSAVQCEHGDGYHVNAEKSIVEIVRRDGTPAAAGEPGEIVGTNLDEFAMPLIHYATGDMSAYREGVCPCGRQLPLIEQIQTRIDDMVVAPDGRLINPAPMAGLFRHHCVQKARVIQEERDWIRVLLVVCDPLPDEIATRIITGIHEVIGSDVRIDIEFVDDIPAGANGKYAFIVSKVPLGV